MSQKYISVFTLAVLSATAAYSQYIPLNTSATRVVGHAQLSLTTTSPNLVEGRELYAPQGIALDTSVSPPILYVADTGNNRVLAWKSATDFQNGATADLVIGQQNKLTTLPQGPGITSFSLGLYLPTSVAVRNGALYVADAGNNRILRFPSPFKQTDVFPDLVIGQASFTTRVANYPNASTTVASAQGLYLSSGGHPALAFDNQTKSNLWVVDAGNRRVLRFSGTDLDNASLTGGLTADLEIGQQDFTTVASAAAATSAAQQSVRDRYNDPAGIAFDKQGNLFVCDRGLSRVMVYKASSFASGMSATRIMGVVLSTETTSTTSSTTGEPKQFVSPMAVSQLSDNNIAVLDTSSNRILIFGPLSQWDDESATFSPAPKGVFGHTDFTTRTVNDGKTAPTASTLSSPAAAALAGSELYVVDSGNNRVIVLPYQSGSLLAGTRWLGQDREDTGSPNLVEGREFRFTYPTTSGTVQDAAVLVDNTSETPHLYVSDPFNNRILGFKDLRKLRPGDKADIVIGQPDFQTTMCNYPANSLYSPTQTSLCHPVGLALDSEGNLYVADTYNSRVLRFPTPFSRSGMLPQADLVLGQSSFTAQITDPTARTMSQPYGLAFAGDNGLVVSDQAHNRMLFFPKVSGGFTNGQAATKVFGQADFSSTASGTGDNKMNSPQLVASDTDGRTYVADFGNSRVLIYDSMVQTPSADAHAAYTLGNLSSPQGVFVSSRTGEIWVTSGTYSLRYARYDQLPVTSSATLAIPSSVKTLAIAQDQYGDLFVADQSNRVAIHFPPVTAINHGNALISRALAPGLLTDIYPVGQSFGSQTASASELPAMVPLPTDLGDIQVLFNDTAAPLYYVSPSQLVMVIPWSAPTTGTAEVQVVKKSTGQILAAGPVSMNQASPAILTSDYTGTTRQAAVLNQDNTVNSSTNPAVRGTVITIFATGQGPVDNPPADGDVPKSGLVSTPQFPRVYIDPCYLDVSPCLTSAEPLSTLQVFSGLSPQYPGLWQINVKLPSAIAAGQRTIFLYYRSQYSIDTSFQTVIYVKEK